MSPGRCTASVGTGDLAITCLGAELQHHRLVEHGEDTEGRDHPGQRAGRAEGPHHEEVHQHPEDGAGHHRRGDGEEHAVAVQHLQPVREVGADQCEAGLGEVDDPRAAVDHDEPEPEQRVDAAGPEAEQSEAQQICHASPVR